MIQRASAPLRHGCASTFACPTSIFCPGCAWPRYLNRTEPRHKANRQQQEGVSPCACAAAIAATFTEPSGFRSGREFAAWLGLVVMALAGETKTIPIVFANFFNPVGSGLIASLARPGGNITGFSNFEPAMAGKWLELLNETASSVTRVVAIFDRANALNTEYAEFAQTAERLAPSFHLQYIAAPVSNAADVQEAIDASAREAHSGLIVMGGTVTSANRETIVRLAAQHRLPAVYAFRYYVTSGGLLSPSPCLRAIRFSRPQGRCCAIWCTRHTLCGGFLLLSPRRGSPCSR